MSDMPTYKIKVKAGTAKDAKKAAKEKCKKDGCDVRGCNMPQSLSEGEWEVEVIVAEAPKKKAKPKLKAVEKSDED